MADYGLRPNPPHDYGIPAFCFGARAENIHGFNERVELESLKKVTKTIALFIAGWCGVEATDP